jgi:hypothetical protein
MSGVDAVSQAVFRIAGEGNPREQVHVATYVVSSDELQSRGHDHEPDVDHARILRSVIMKPESEAEIPTIHARLEQLAREAD